MKNTNIKVYHYSGCSTCRKAIQFLNSKKIEFEAIAIRENPPNISELKKAKRYLGELKILFNVSGNDYREGNWKEKIQKISEEEALKALSANGNLVKRPFVVLKEGFLVGFKEEEWKLIFK
ncbi:MAG: Spx/MgsR family RNA polymerase-binding regulatory protein [Leptospira sp.]|nr:Spx/MgsR family RNA polymerase-binding regulatory protein [Leptospira sp.]